MKVTASVHNALHKHEVVVTTDAFAKKINIASTLSGFGSSVNGAELLLLSSATCFCNDIYREAIKRNLKISGVKVEVTGGFGNEGEAGYDFTYKADVVSDESATAIKDLINYTDGIAEIHNTLRKGLSITLLN